MRRLCVVTVLMGLTLACGGSPTTSSATVFSVSGTVIERTPTGDRTVAGATVRAWVQEAGHGYALAQGATTDAMGRYTLANVPASVVVVGASSSGLLQPCVATATVTRDAALNVTLVSSANASILTLSGSPSFSGVVFQTTPNGPQTIAGAMVSFGASGGDLTFANTVSDSNGHYTLCTLPSDPSLQWAHEIVVDKTGFSSADIDVAVIGDAQLNIELKQQ